MKESSVLEYKKEVTKAFLKTVSAFANYGNGRIVFGVEDSGNVVGLNSIESNRLSIENAINDNISPVPKFRLLENEDNTITLSVYEGGSKPYYYNGKAYKRSDTTTIQVDRLELNRLILEGSNINFEELKSSLSDLNFKELEERLKPAIGIKKFNKDILKTLQLYNDEDGYNIAAELVADNNSFQIIDIIRFGDSINEILDREEYHNMSVLRAFEYANNLYRKYYHVERIDGVVRNKFAKIPESAFREALANGLVHRCWDVNSSIRISMYNDRIEISSPGALMEGVSEEEYLNGQVSVLRNPILGGIFYRLHLIEKFGTSIRRILEAYKDSIVKPDFKFYQNSILVVLPVINTSESFLAKEEIAVYNLLNKENEMSRSDLEKRIGFSKDKSIRVLNGLIEKNVIVKIGEGRGTKYRIK